jgi:excisionase family DNA binding protein
MTEVLQPTMTVEELAAILRVQPAVIYKEVSAGNLPGFKIGEGVLNFV